MLFVLNKSRDNLESLPCSSGLDTWNKAKNDYVLKNAFVSWIWLYTLHQISDFLVHNNMDILIYSSKRCFANMTKSNCLKFTVLENNFVY